MKNLVCGLFYILFIILVVCTIPWLMIPVFQNFGLSARDVVGFTMIITMISVILLMGFGALLWSERS